MDINFFGIERINKLNKEIRVMVDSNIDIGNTKLYEAVDNMERDWFTINWN
jgi:hypothetical protein